MATAREDLIWLFASCESEMGIKSNFASFILASKLGVSQREQEELEGEDAMIDALDKRRAVSRMAATGRNRRVMAAYGRLDVGHQRALEAAFEPRQHAPLVLKALGAELAGVAPLTATARRLGQFSRAWLARAVGRQEGQAAQIATQIKAEAAELLAAALAAFEAARAGTVGRAA